MRLSWRSQGRWIAVVALAVALFVAQVAVLVSSDRVAGPVLGMMGAAVLMYCGARGLNGSTSRRRADGATDSR